jgi:hypothetical protein
MLISDIVTAGEDREVWLAGVLKDRSDDVQRLYLVYNDHLMGPDSAREIWVRVVGEDFVASVESDIVSAESVRASRQQGVIHPAGDVAAGVTHHWFIEVYVDDTDLWDVLGGG